MHLHDILIVVMKSGEVLPSECLGLLDVRTHIALVLQHTLQKNVVCIIRQKNYIYLIIIKPQSNTYANSWCQVYILQKVRANTTHTPTQLDVAQFHGLPASAK